MAFLNFATHADKLANVPFQTFGKAVQAACDLYIEAPMERFMIVQRPGHIQYHLIRWSLFRTLDSRDMRMSYLIKFQGTLRHLQSIAHNVPPDLFANLPATAGDNGSTPTEESSDAKTEE